MRDNHLSSRDTDDFLRKHLVNPVQSNNFEPTTFQTFLEKDYLSLRHQKTSVMVRYRVNRKFLDLKDSDLISFLEIVGKNISTEPMFSSIAAKGIQLLNKNTNFHTTYLAVLEGDYRQLADREKLRAETETLAREIANDVNKLADGNEVVITAAGFKAITTPTKDRSKGVAKLRSVKYLPGLNMVKLRIYKADLAVDYQIDISKDAVIW